MIGGGWAARPNAQALKTVSLRFSTGIGAKERMAANEAMATSRVIPTPKSPRSGKSCHYPVQDRLNKGERAKELN